MAKFWVDKTCSLVQNYGFTAKELSEIADIINANASKIKEAWNGFFFK
ncbi:MAG: DUF4160 domain-containing protein [Treponema sp.]|nr:DUF4160 domain-containing protein [Treponema sp.]